MRTIGVVARGVRAPILKAGDDLLQIAVDSVLAASNESKVPMQDHDILAVTESCVARTQGNYATIDQIAQAIRQKITPQADGKRRAGLVFPILSRNRFSMLLRAFALALDEIYIQLSYPADEVGNQLISIDAIDDHGINPYSDILMEEDFRRIFGAYVPHHFTNIDYISLYKEYAPQASLFLANDPRAILRYTDQVVACDIHSRHRTMRILRKAGAVNVLSLADFLNEPVDGSGYNPEYGLYGSNLATENSVKLFPRDGQAFAEALAKRLLQVTGKHVEVMLYGDGALKDPVCGIWELADPVVSPGYTKGLEGTPNELKLKYFIDTELKGTDGSEAYATLREAIRHKAAPAPNAETALGTTPRQITDLVGSLADLTSGSGDKGTPFVWIQGYFDSYATE